MNNSDRFNVVVTLKPPTNHSDRFNVVVTLKPPTNYSDRLNVVVTFKPPNELFWQVQRRCHASFPIPSYKTFECDSKGDACQVRNDAGQIVGAATAKNTTPMTTKDGKEIKEVPKVFLSEDVDKMMTLRGLSGLSVFLIFCFSVYMSVFLSVCRLKWQHSKHCQGNDMTTFRRLDVSSFSTWSFSLHEWFAQYPFHQIDLAACETGKPILSFCCN